VNPYGVDIMVPGTGVTLAQGTTFPSGRVLNYDVPLQSFIMQAGTELPVAVTLRQTVTLPANTVLRGEVIDAEGNVYTAGTLLREPLVLATGATLGVGFMLTEHTRINDVVWPADVPLPVRMRNAASTLTDPVVLASDLVLKLGAVIPGEASLVFPDGAEEVPLRPVVDGWQAANWAIAGMLPAGSHSWDIRLVAGADTAAADSRITQPRGVRGNLVVADHHYQFAGIWQSTADVRIVWAEGNILEMPPGEEVSEVDLFLCDMFPGSCLEVAQEPKMVWAEGNILEMPVGEEVSEVDIFLCDMFPGSCVQEGGAGEEELVGRVYSGESFSVIRTGIGDLDLISGADLRVDSLYGIYTAGTPLAEVT